jgi:PDZ domain-containing protein
VASYIKELIREEYKFIIFLILLYCILQTNVNYYIITGGGTSDVATRIEVSEKYKSKGSFNISYVTELQRASVITYLLSYVIPTWEREDANLYKYSTTESLEDIQFRSELDLKTANGTATYWAYTLANKEVHKTDTNIYVITIFPDYNNNLKIGDKIISMDDQHYETIEEYKAYLQTKKAQDTVSIKIIRKDKEMTVDSVLSESENQLVLGVGLQIVNTYDTDPPVKISFKSTESGPSGGLITTLEIYNQLTKKDLTHGLKIAGTGTIELDGTIGQIGGIEHKLLGAEDDHTDIFLSPSGENYQAALKYKKKKKLKIKIIEVTTIEDAIEKLENLK